MLFSRISENTDDFNYSSYTAGYRLQTENAKKLVEIFYMLIKIDKHLIKTENRPNIVEI